MTSRLVERIHRLGTIGFDEYLDAALYDPQDGFYSAGRGPGRRSDFLTSPEVGPLFGEVVARALDQWWEELDRPDPFLVVEAGAAAGSLAQSVLAASPACSPALRYVLVERSAALRAQQAERFALELPALALGPRRPVEDGPSGDSADDDVETVPLPGWGPVVTSLAELPAGPLVGVVLANELLDNLPFGLCERGPDGWLEVRVGARQGSLVEVLVPASPDLSDSCHRLAPDAPPCSRIPIQLAAGEWVRQACALLARGRVVAFDYAEGTTAALAARPWTQWVRTYRSHGPGAHPLEGPGGQDVTCEVAVDQLHGPGAPFVTTQAEFMRQHGIDELAATARETWRERAAAPDLTALAARSRVGEAEALTDTTGLGGFLVLSWEV